MALSPHEIEEPPGIAVNIIPRNIYAGTAVYPAPGAEPSDYLPNGRSLYVDCLQQVRPNYILARISSPPFKNHYVDVFEIKTPNGGDVRTTKPPLPLCGPIVDLITH
jgi:hypothetical protein